MKKFIYDSSILEKQMVTQNNCQRIDKIKLSGALDIKKVRSKAVDWYMTRLKSFLQCMFLLPIIESYALLNFRNITAEKKIT